LLDQAGTSLDCQPLPRDKRKTSGASQGNCSEALGPDRRRDFEPPGQRTNVKRNRIAAGAFGVRVQYLDVLTGKDIETASRNASKGRTDALLVLGGGVLASHRTQIVEFALKNRLPAIFPQNEFVEAGGLMYYG
jgi:hypothetical protein